MIITGPITIGATAGPFTITMPIDGASTAGATWYPTFTYPGVTVPNKSTSCPFCTPRCPHGYPADQPANPIITSSTTSCTVSPCPGPGVCTICPPREN